MCTNKECLIIILDVRQSAATATKRNAVKCIADILKEKICTGKKDYVSFVLLGTQRTFNDVNSNIDHDGYQNIVQYPQAVIPTWNLLVEFMKFVTEPSCSEGDWLDALVVAMEVLKNGEGLPKVQHQRIVLFHDFDSPDLSYDMFDCITENLMKVDIKLTVVSSNIQYIDNAATDEPQAIFCASTKKTDFQMVNEKYALRLVSNCNAKLCNFQEAYSIITRLEHKRPWCWNSTLSIGTQIIIKVAGMLAIKDCNEIKFKKCYGTKDEQVTREKKSLLKSGEEIEPELDELIDGYMLGSTPIAFDESVQEEKETHQPGLSLLGFTKRSAVPEEYYCGDSLYLVTHQKGMQSSAKKLDALVKALLKAEMAMLCWRVYSVKHNNPKIVLLLPNKMHENRPASLSMVELAYNAQHHFYDFPSLRTQKSECTAEQLDAIDNLIDAMDLMLSPKDAQQPRDTIKKELLPFDMLPHIYEQCLLDMLERKVLCVAGEEDDYIHDLVAEKDYKEVYWQVPEPIEQLAKSAASKVKNLFPLEENPIVDSKAKQKPTVKAETNNNANDDNNKNANTSDNNKPSAKKLECVGAITPADDFEMLLKQEVLTLQDNTLRDAKFHLYAEQMRSTIWKLLFEKKPLAADKISEALKVFRKCSYDFNAFSDYNEWLRELKTKIVEEKLYDFWTNYVVKEDLGLCFVGALSLEEKLDLAEFYKIDDYESREDNTTENAEVDNMADAVDAFLANI